MQELINSLPNPLASYGGNQLPEDVRSKPSYKQLYEATMRRYRMHQELDGNEWAVLRNCPIQVVEVHYTETWTKVRNRHNGQITYTQVPKHPSNTWHKLGEICEDQTPQPIVGPKFHSTQNLYELK